MGRFYVYILYSLKDGECYVGIIENVKERLKRHNEGRVVSTKGRIPFSLIQQEAFSSREAARKREKFLKSGSGRTYLDKLKKLSASVVELADTPA